MTRTARRRFVWLPLRDALVLCTLVVVGVLVAASFTQAAPQAPTLSVRTAPVAPLERPSWPADDIQSSVAI